MKLNRVHQSRSLVRAWAGMAVGGTVLTIKLPHCLRFCLPEKRFKSRIVLPHHRSYIVHYFSLYYTMCTYVLLNIVSFFVRSSFSLAHCVRKTFSEFPGDEFFSDFFFSQNDGALAFFARRNFVLTQLNFTRKNKSFLLPARTFSYL